MRAVLSAIALCVAAAPWAAAQTDADRAGAAAAIDRFETAFFEADAGGVMAVMPPALLTLIADRAGVAPDVLLPQLESQMAGLMRQVTFENFSMDLDAAEWGETPSGITYAAIPTVTEFIAPASGRTRSETTTLALQEDDTWYLIRVDDAQQMSLLRQAYPGFADVEFESGTTEALD